MPGPLDWLMTKSNSATETPVTPVGKCISSTSTSQSPQKGAHRRHCSPKKKLMNYVTRPRPPMIWIFNILSLSFWSLALTVSTSFNSWTQKIPNPCCSNQTAIILSCAILQGKVFYMPFLSKHANFGIGYWICFLPIKNIAESGKMRIFYF